MSRQIASRYDEDDVRVRPGRHKSRPRTKDRPEHKDAHLGVVVAVDRGRFTIVLDDADGETIYAVKAREIGRKGIVVGDRVAVAGAEDADEHSHARIVRREERTSQLRRTADDTDPVERVIVANATQLAIVAATTNPEPRIGLIDRAIVAALDAGITPILIITKPDLASPQPLIDLTAAMDVQSAVVDHGHPAGIGPDVHALLAGETTVLIGHSGVGKSSLVNALVPHAERDIGDVNVVTGKGRHTSTSARAFELPASGGNPSWIIDTPGIRSFGLAHVDPARVVAAFPDLAAATANCPRSCSHDETDCALDSAVAGHELGARRLASLRRLLSSMRAQ